jgi:hypothetical protein
MASTKKVLLQLLFHELHTHNRKKRTKGTTLLSLIEPFQPIAVRVVACCCRATTFSRFFFKCSRSSMAIYSFLSEPVTHFPPPYYHGTRFDAFWLDWNNRTKKGGNKKEIVKYYTRNPISCSPIINDSNMISSSSLQRKQLLFFFSFFHPHPSLDMHKKRQKCWLLSTYNTLRK